MKQIKIITDLTERAEKKGVAVKRARCRYNWGYSYALDNLVEVYRVENNGQTVSLFHYGTLTASVDLESMRLVSVYGESRSDVDSVNTFLSWLGFEFFSFGYRPVNGGFYLLTFNGSSKAREETFLVRDGEDAVLKAFNGDSSFKVFKSLEN